MPPGVAVVAVLEPQQKMEDQEGDLHLALPLELEFLVKDLTEGEEYL
jgi:hypothetical protein